MKKTLSELFGLPIEEVREHFNITAQYTFAVNRLKELRNAIMDTPEWCMRDNLDKLKYIDKAIIHYQGNLDEWYSGSNTAVRTKLSDEHYDVDKC